MQVSETASWVDACFTARPASARRIYRREGRLTNSFQLVLDTSSPTDFKGNGTWLVIFGAFSAFRMMFFFCQTKDRVGLHPPYHPQDV